MPVSNELNFTNSTALRRIPYEVNEISSAWPWMIIATGGAEVDVHKRL